MTHWISSMKQVITLLTRITIVLCQNQVMVNSQKVTLKLQVLRMQNPMEKIECSLQQQK